MSILAVDPATLSGWAMVNTTTVDMEDMADEFVGFGKRFKYSGSVHIKDTLVDYGTYNAARLTKTKKREAEAPHYRTYHLFHFLRELIIGCEVERVVCEEAAAFQRGKAAVEVAHKLRASVELAVLDASNVPVLTYVGPNDIKEFALNKRSGDKEEMIAAAREMYGYNGIEDNEADALHVMGWALQ